MNVHYAKKLLFFFHREHNLLALEMPVFKFCAEKEINK
jgi:hypothetical protein